MIKLFRLVQNVHQCVQHVQHIQHGVGCLGFLLRMGVLGLAMNVGMSVGMSAMANTLPDWFANRTLMATEHLLIGYGTGATEQQASNRARAEIAEQLHSDVRSELACETRVQQTYVDNSDKANKQMTEKVDEKCNQQLTLSSDIRLSNSRIVKQAIVDGAWYVAVEYDQTPILQKLLKVLTAKDCAGVDSKANDFNLPIQRQVVERLGCMPKWSLNHLDGQWQLLIAGRNLSVRRNEMSEFWVSAKSPKLIIKAPKKIANQQPYFVKLIVKQAGFISLFSITDWGQVSVLIENQRIKIAKQTTSKKIIFPDSTQYDGLESMLRDEQAIGKELFLLARCNQPIALEQLSVVEENWQETLPFNYHHLLTQIKACDITTHRLQISSD